MMAANNKMLNACFSFRNKFRVLLALYLIHF